MMNLRIRDARRRDCRLYWQWANDLSTRQASFSTEPIEWATHRDWFRAHLQNPNCLMFVIESGTGEPVAQVRFEVDFERATASVSVDPAKRGRGIGAAALRVALDELWSRSPELVAVDAYIRRNNLTSIAVFRKCGFSCVEELCVQGQDAFRLQLARPSLDPRSESDPS